MEDDDSKKRRRELEVTILEKVGDVITSIKDAKHVDQVICALHSLAVRLFSTLQSQALSGSIDQQYRDQVLGAKVPSEKERSDWWRVFYQCAAFPTLARVLLYDVASNWRACFPFSARKHVYDAFFVNGLTVEVVQTVVPALQQDGNESFDIKIVRSNAERVLALCLIENDGVLQMAREFGGSGQYKDISSEQLNSTICRVAQLVTSIPDKAQLGTSNSLSSHWEETITGGSPKLKLPIIIISTPFFVLALCLIENDGVLQMAREFGGSGQYKDISSEQLNSTICRVAQLVTSIPDKAQLGTSDSLSSQPDIKAFFINLTWQKSKEFTGMLSLCIEGLHDLGFDLHYTWEETITGGPPKLKLPIIIISTPFPPAEEWDMNLCNKEAIFLKNGVDSIILFVGESFARICRRGSADVLLSEVITQILRHVRSTLSRNADVVVSEVFETKAGSWFWLMLLEAIRDPYAVERLSEQLLRQLAAERVTDIEAYWILWILFHRTYERQTSFRSLFLEKFLLWKVFPVCCLRWILQFAVLEFPPDAPLLEKGHNSRGLLDRAQQLAVVWSKREFVQSAPVEQQVPWPLIICSDVTAALGFCLEKMSKEDLDATKDMMGSILQGVSCRLENPAHLVRRMASSIALVFSKIIDPKNPLYLDDSCSEEVIDWEFGLAAPEKGTLNSSQCIDKDVDELKTCSGLFVEKDFNNTDNSWVGNSGKVRTKKLSEFKLVDPDEIIDPATLNNQLVSGEEDDADDDASENSEISSDSSLQPYDLSDDDIDLRRKFSHLVDVVGALRKSEDADGVERAVDVTEKLIRASPDELRYVAGDLVRALVQVRCSDSTIEGEEESAEEKRQKSLVALIVTSPFESLDTLNKLLYSPSVDTSQRIMILDVMTDAAQELADTKITKPKHQPRNLISTVSETQPWFMPSSLGPPGAGPWKEIHGTEAPLNWSYSYERELPLRAGQIKSGKTRRWSFRSENIRGHQTEWLQNKFPLYAAAFMLPAMQGFDKKRHGVDLLGRDFIVLGKLIYMLGVCMKCAAMHPEASALAPPLMDMLRSREICHHAEAYVRRSVLFAAACILVALHPSYVASSLVEGSPEISKGLEWVRTWALQVAESDTDRDCYTLAVTCLQLHAEMALQASRALESKAKNIDMPSNLLKGTIKIPH